ncbi:MAG: TetR/AcrR family transcriptional regulator [Myxococcales bacterium]|nr:TetR/AcrR family transcriptional regulator [Myxococcales bacterium]MCB9714178.1 TetR/AcrR family transcriptional regulator [Myxococcales bacterium]
MGRCSDARDRLLAVASQLVHERGYTAVSVSDICKAAGLKKGSFYHFFRSKHELVLATLDRFAEHQEVGMQQALQSGRPVSEQLAGMLTSMYAGYMRAKRNFGSAHGCPLGNLAQEMAHRDTDIQNKLATIFARWQTQLIFLLRRAADRGELRVPDAERSAEALVAYVQGVTLLAKTTNDPDVFLRLAHGMVALAQAELPTAPAPIDVEEPSHSDGLHTCQASEVLS